MKKITILFFLIFLLSKENSWGVICVAHRAAVDDCLENSMDCFIKSIEEGPV